MLYLVKVEADNGLDGEMLQDWEYMLGIADSYDLSKQWVQEFIEERKEDGSISEYEEKEENGESYWVFFHCDFDHYESYDYIITIREIELNKKMNN